MSPRLLIRSFIWGFCLAIVLLGARSARAYAPICDETATSRLAPPPVLPIRDVKFELGSPCDAPPTSEAPVTVSPIDHRPPATPAVSSDTVTIEAWFPPTDMKISASAASGGLVWSVASLARKPGFLPGVFRPPRG